MDPRQPTAGQAAAVANPQILILTLPPVFAADILSPLIDLSEDSIRTYRCSRPDHLPPWCELPGPRCVWLAEEVLAWIATYRKGRPVPAKKRGAPTKRARLAARAAAAAAAEGGAA